jgi:hypothetical protein
MIINRKPFRYKDYRMKTLDRKFTDKELEMIAVCLSQLGGELADEDDSFIGSLDWKRLWEVQEYFNSKANEL